MDRRFEAQVAVGKNFPAIEASITSITGDEQGVPVLTGPSLLPLPLSLLRFSSPFSFS